jgi:hypothetical protein
MILTTSPVSLSLFSARCWMLEIAQIYRPPRLHTGIIIKRYNSIMTESVEIYVLLIYTSRRT